MCYIYVLHFMNVKTTNENKNSVLLTFDFTRYVVNVKNSVDLSIIHVIVSSSASLQCLVLSKVGLYIKIEII